MAIHLSAPRAMELKPRIVVFGIGGAGGNAVNNMIEAGLEGVEFVVANTDAQQLQFSKTDARVQLGASVTQGLGAGAHPEVGMTAAEESAAEIAEHLDGAHMVFITAGMGGGTGTGAAPVIAKCARERGILTVGVVTKPFMFEGRHRMRLADAGIAELQRYVDTLIVIPNQNLFRIANEQTTFAEAFGMADQVLHAGVRSITDLMVLPGLINLDFADVRSTMSDMGKAMMGTGEASGEDRAAVAAHNAIQNPLLDETSLNGARAVLINVTGGHDMTLHEIDVAANVISAEVDPDANIIFGAAFDPELQGRLRVSVVATGMDSSAAQSVPLAAATTARPVAAAPLQPQVQAPIQAPIQAQPVAASAPVAEPAPVSAQSPVAAVQRSSLFEGGEGAAASAPAAPEFPVAETKAPAPVAEPRVIGRIVDPMVDDTFPMDLTAEEVTRAVHPAPAAPVQAPAPRPAPTIQRPSYAQPEARPAPVSQPVSRPSAFAPPQEEEREPFWRGLFPQRNKSVPQAYEAPARPAASREPMVTDEADRYVPGAPTAKTPTAKAQPVGRAEIQPSAMESEEDLEIPSFLRRLAN